MCMTGGIVVCQAIDEADLRMTAQNGRYVHCRNSIARRQRDELQILQNTLHLRANFTLKRPNDNILPTFFSAATLIEHAVGFADARRISKKYFQAATALIPLFGLNLPEQAIRIRTGENARQIESSE